MKEPVVLRASASRYRCSMNNGCYQFDFRLHRHYGVGLTLPMLVQGGSSQLNSTICFRMHWSLIRRRAECQPEIETEWRFRKQMATGTGMWTVQYNSLNRSISWGCSFAKKPFVVRYSYLDKTINFCFFSSLSVRVTVLTTTKMQCESSFTACEQIIVKFVAKSVTVTTFFSIVL